MGREVRAAEIERGTQGLPAHLPREAATRGEGHPASVLCTVDSDLVVDDLLAL